MGKFYIHPITLVSLLISLQVCQEVSGQNKVKFNGIELNMSELRTNDKSVILSKSFAGKKLVIAEGTQETFGTGLALGNNRFLISVPTNAGGKELYNSGIRAWAPVSATQKLVSDLRNTLESSPNAAAMDVNILVAPGINEKQIRTAWNPSWGTIKEVWSGGEIIRFTVNASPAQIQSLSEQGWTMQIEEGEGEIIPHNQVAADNGRVNTISNAGFGWTSGLTGNGVTVAIGDGGLVDSHGDLESRQFNLVTSKLSSFTNHPDHVTGTIAGAGLIDANSKGMAPGARVLNHQTTNVISNAIILRTKQNATLTNNSYGNTLSCTKAGNYNSTSSMMDGQTANYPDLLHVVSSGNAGTTTCSPYPAGYFNMAEGLPVAKNCLTVGAVQAADAAATWSSKGPMKDGRLKPEIVTNGNDIYSTIPTDGYGIKSGTSQAAPVITGTLALLTERFRQLNSNNNPDASLLKALVCNTADDLGLANADFTYGFGRLNARKARRVLEAGRYTSNTLSSNSSRNFTITVPAGASSVKVMLAWTDPAAAASPIKALINDLNLSVLRADGSTFLPWVANPSTASVTQAAVRGIDSLNNMEQVTLSVSPGEVLTIRTNSKTISGSTQKYWIVYDWVSPEFVFTAPQRNQMMKTATAFGFRWDMSGYTFSSLVLETSSDSTIWSTAQTIASPTSQYSAYTPTGTTHRKAWFRFKGISSGEAIYSNAVKVILSPQPTVSVVVCERSARLSWAAVSGATRYEYMKLNRNKGVWETIGYTTSLFAYFGGLENGKREILAVTPWFSNEAGLRSLGIAATPAAGTCPWTKDLGISKILSPVSGRLLTSTAPSTTIQLEIQNYSNTAVTNQACQLNYRKSNGIVLQYPLSLSIAAGQKQNYTIPEVFLNSVAGTQNMRFWLTTSGDLNTSNDTLKTEVKVLSNLPERSFPLTINFENLTPFYTTSNTTGFSGEDRMDFNSINQSRLFSSVKNPPLIYGANSLVLDKEKLNTLTGTGEATITLNLSAFPNPKEMKLSFDFLSFGSQTSGNGLSFRPSDQAAWIPIKNFWQESFIAGVSKNYSDIDLIPLLAGAAPTTSFQLKFSFRGQRNSEIETLGGYAIDNIKISIPSADVSANGLELPPVNCYQDNENRPVKITVQNLSATDAQNVPVTYCVAGYPTVTDTIATILANSTVTYTFNRGLNSQQFGNLSIRAWASCIGDGNTSNDTLPTQKTIHYRTISSFPSYESFETNNGSWASYSNNGKSSWEWGKGIDEVSAFDSAANGIFFWYNNPKEIQALEDSNYLQSPCYNLSKQSNDFQISFNNGNILNKINEQVWMEISEDGINWSKLGASGSEYNWDNGSGEKWGNINWQSSSIKINLANFNNKKRLRFRMVLLQPAGNSEQRFALDDVNIEAASNVIMINNLNETGQSSNSGEWLTFGNEGNIAAQVAYNPSMGNLNLLLNIQPENSGIRSFEGQPYLDRNFLLLPNFSPSQVQKIRLFISNDEITRLQLKDFNLTSFQNLGIFRYYKSQNDFTPENNDYSSSSNFEFISPANVLKVPTYGGHYLEFESLVEGEFYITTSSFVNSALGLRLNQDETAPHQPIEVRWLTPVLENNEGKLRSSKLAYLDPSNKMLFVDGLNGNSSRILIANLKGQVILNESFNGYRFETSLAGMAKGLYTLRVEQESGAETFRILID
jgi:hypothetical protein